jgi:hypothetical protein
MTSKRQYRVTVKGEKRAVLQNGLFVANGWDTYAEAEAARAIIAGYDRKAVVDGWIETAPALSIELF